MDWYDKVTEETGKAEKPVNNALNTELVEVVEKHDDTMLSKANAMLDD